jgi:hypothetical protein
MDAEKVLAIANLLNKYGPSIIALILKFKDARGDEQTIDLLEEAGAKFDANIAQAKAALGE